MDNKKFSIIVPVYNAEKYIEKCVKSILAQTYKNWELIIVNDGSTDHTDDICRYLHDQERRIQYIIKKNEGVSKARNVGVNVARGDILLFVDADDWVEPDMLEMIADAWQPETDLLMFGYYEARGSQKDVCNFFEQNIEFSADPKEPYNKKFLVLNILQYYRNANKKVMREVGVPWAKAFSTQKIREHQLKFPEDRKSVV